MKKKTKIMKQRWTVKVKAADREVKDAPVVATLESHELAMFIISENEADGLRRAIGRANADRKSLWDMAAEKYGFEKGAYSHSLNLKTGEIAKNFFKE